MWQTIDMHLQLVPFLDLFTFLHEDKIDFFISALSANGSPSRLITVPYGSCRWQQRCGLCRGQFHDRTICGVQHADRRLQIR